MILNKCSCGCTVLKNKMVLTREGTKGIYTCPRHKTGTIVTRFIYCIECGKKRFLTGLKSGGKTIRCKKCQKEFNNRTMREWRGKSKDSRKRYDKQADPNKRANCKKIATCLMKYIEYDNIPCKDCEEFGQQDFSRDVYECDFSYTERTRLVTHQ